MYTQIFPGIAIQFIRATIAVVQLENYHFRYVMIKQKTGWNFYFSSKYLDYDSEIKKYVASIHKELSEKAESMDQLRREAELSYQDRQLAKYNSELYSLNKKIAEVQKLVWEHTQARTAVYHGELPQYNPTVT